MHIENDAPIRSNTKLKPLVDIFENLFHQCLPSPHPLLSYYLVQYSERRRNSRKEPFQRMDRDPPSLAKGSLQRQKSIDRESFLLDYATKESKGLTNHTIDEVCTACG